MVANEFAQLFPATEITWNTATSAVRVSMVLLYSRIFAPVKLFKYVCWMIIFINLANWVAVVVASGLICRPLSYIYFRVGKGSCGNIRALETYTAVSSIVFDAATVALPLPCLWSLQMKTRRKIAISFVLGLGIM